jgi:mono/diheme cytochrome c family protein
MRRILATTIIFAACGLSTGRAAEKLRADFDNDIRPLLNQFCVRCHGPEEQNGRMRFDTLSTDLIKDRAAAEDWHETLNVLNRGEMPPEDEPQPSVDQLQLLTGWIRSSIDDAIKARRSTAQDREVVSGPV